jgi:hypothetical protein
MSHLFDTDRFPVGAAGAYFLRNLVRINVFGAKNALFATLQFLVKMNTCPGRNVKKTCFFEVPAFGGREAAIREAGSRIWQANKTRNPRLCLVFCGG